ncbi:MAG: hypothetical protein Q8P84_07110 [Deltaproteobacteria bacterium]|nr:hypothetical protein [Deltaproteobacteria bacterium]
MLKLAWLFFVPLFFIIPSASAKEGSCAQCHQTLKTSSLLEHNYADWKGSIHAQKGVGCEACHGGNPATTDPVKAHQGVLPSGNKSSSVYFKNVGKTCGKCHAAEYTEFRKSAHYRMLQNTGKGPNCLTCHGSMATTVMKYKEMESTCSLCHGKPSLAAKALSLIDTAKRSLDLYQKKLAQKWGTKIPKEDQEKEKEYLLRYRQIQQMWHSFDVTKVTEISEALIKDLTHK